MIPPVHVRVNYASGLTSDQEKRVQEMRDRDALVERHEEAHYSEAGQFAIGGIHYDYETGPDGRAYRVGGHVNLDVSEVAGDPKATIDKMRVVQRSALAPSSFDDLSDADRRVFARAQWLESKAHQELELMNQAMAGQPLQMFA